ncbi:hypothetical protein [Chryseobacterium herbae]|uniref:Uncharacterized protein n=1 Tax=Chryseobacterium herbae TaxID=2976476 RepID=A0ABT2ISY0_9FLAO|nr:hypothetical protein [Chryseobacterium sp. pc1-10]MCT2561837.1 hypothetical protein [Chryseobacterium sp. pc1-10]
MNKLKTAVAAILIAGGTLAAFAFSPAKTETKTEATVYYWFEVGSNNYLGQDTKANIQDDHCGPEGLQPCARAYSAISGTPGNEVPVGAQVDQARKQ